jgi:hypothetical protein
MRLACLLLAAGLCIAPGCTVGRLRQRTINQGATLPALQYQQVLDNLARLTAMAPQPQRGNFAGHGLAFGGRGGGPRPSGHMVPTALGLEDRRGTVGDVAGD